MNVKKNIDCLYLLRNKFYKCVCLGVFYCYLYKVYFGFIY